MDKQQLVEMWYVQCLEASQSNYVKAVTIPPTTYIQQY